MLKTMNQTRMRCPTCRAEQTWSDTCRRCKADLRLLRELAETTQEQRQHVLAQLGAGRYRDALQRARELCLLDHGQANLRLLAVCYVLSGHPASALRILKSTRDSPQDTSQREAGNVEWGA